MIMEIKIRVILRVDSVPTGSVGYSHRLLCSMRGMQFIETVCEKDCFDNIKREE